MTALQEATRPGAVPVLGKDQIDMIAERVLDDYDPRLIDQAAAIDIDHFSECYLGLQMDYQDLSAGRSVLGMMVFADCRVPVYDARRKEQKLIAAREGTILVDNSLVAGDQHRRERFTIAHETGHWLLHRNVYRRPAGGMPRAAGRSFVRCRTFFLDQPRRPLLSDDDWLEWQANYLASALLMPRTPFRRLVLKRYAAVGFRAARCVRGSDPACDLWLDYLARELSDRFQVSLSAAAIRLRNLRLVIKGRN